jgi:hypothetical protein
MVFQSGVGELWEFLYTEKRDVIDMDISLMSPFILHYILGRNIPLLVILTSSSAY